MIAMSLPLPPTLQARLTGPELVQLSGLLLDEQASIAWVHHPRTGCPGVAISEPGLRVEVYECGSQVDTLRAALDRRARTQELFAGVEL